MCPLVKWIFALLLWEFSPSSFFFASGRRCFDFVFTFYASVLLRRRSPQRCLSDVNSLCDSLSCIRKYCLSDWDWGRRSVVKTFQFKWCQNFLPHLSSADAFLNNDVVFEDSLCRIMRISAAPSKICSSCLFFFSFENEIPVNALNSCLKKNNNPKPNLLSENVNVEPLTTWWWDNVCAELI